MNRPRSPRPLNLEGLETRDNPGGGSFDATTGTFNFSVAVRYDATEAELADIRNSFQIASDVIADATDGQHRFGNVTIVNGSTDSAEAEFYVWKRPTTNPGRANAQAAGYGTRGLTSNLYQNGSVFQGGTTKDANGVSAAGITIAHEFAHQAYGILDEYSGPLIGPDGRPVLDSKGNAVTITAGIENAPTDSSKLNFSLMDNYFTRGGRGSPYTLNEFSVAKNHDPDNDTWQSFSNRRDDWAQVATRYPVTIPSGLPQDKAPTSVPVNFRMSTTNSPFTVLALENTSSISSDLFDLIRTGSAIYIQTTKSEESLGVLHYNSGLTITSPIRRMSAENQTTAILASNSTPRSNDPVAEPGEALRTAMSFIESRADSPNRVIVLVGSGVRSATLNILDFVPQLNQLNISVITILVNPNPTIGDSLPFRTLAQRTGGQFISIDNTDDFVGLVATFAGYRQGNGILASAPPSNLAANGTVTETVVVAPGTPEVILGSASLTPGASYTLTLQSPSGQVISAPGPGVEQLPPGPIIGFRVANPEPGLWTVLSTAGPSDVGPVAVVGLQPDDPYRVVVSAEQGEVAFPAPVQVRVTPTFEGKAVVGATVTGLATSPTGAQTPMLFFDDGLPVHGDAMPGDGIYSALFSGYSNNGSGVYTFSAVVNGFGTTTSEGEDLHGDGVGSSVPDPVPDFTRTGSGTVVVTGVPATVVANDLGIVIIPVSPTTIALAVQNNGPTTANGIRANLFVGGSLNPLGGTASQGTFTFADSSVTFDVGSLDPGATATLTLTLGTRFTGLANLLADVSSTSQTDPLFENNFAALQAPFTVMELVAVGADRGSGALLAFNPVTQAKQLLTPFGTFSGGVRTASADFNGDGVFDLVVGTGPGSATQVRILDGRDGTTELFSIDPFEASFTGGVYVAVGDLNGDGFPDLVITPDEGGGPRARVFSGAPGFAQLADFLGINDPNFRGGARPALGDFNGDGMADLVVAAGFGGGPRVAVFSGSMIAIEGTRPDAQTIDRWETWKLFGDFLTFEPELRNGSFVSAGDVTGDGLAELVAGGGPGGGPRVSVFGGAELLAGTRTRLTDFFAGDVSNRGGVRLAVRNLDGDTNLDLLAGDGTGAGSKVRAYAGAVLTGSAPPELLNFDAFPDFSGGVFIG